MKFREIVELVLKGIAIIVLGLFLFAGLVLGACFLLS